MHVDEVPPHGWWLLTPINEIASIMPNTSMSLISSMKIVLSTQGTIHWTNSIMYIYSAYEVHWCDLILSTCMPDAPLWSTSWWTNFHPFGICQYKDCLFVHTCFRIKFVQYPFFLSLPFLFFCFLFALCINLPFCSPPPNPPFPISPCVFPLTCRVIQFQN